MSSVKKWQLSCCALCQLTASDDTPIEDLQKQLKKLQEEAKETWNYSDRRSGERAAFVITTANEHTLRRNLIKLGFEKAFDFPRRNGYPRIGNNTMWFKTW